MQRKTLFLIPPEGWAVLAGLAVALVLVNAVAPLWAALPWVALIAFGVAYFRDAPRNVPGEPLSVIAPADGRIVYHGRCHDPYLDRDAIKLSLRLSLFGAYLLRAPVEGTVLELPANDHRGGVASRIRTDEGDEIVLAIRRGRLFGAEPCRGDYGKRVGQGRCCGMRRLALQVDVYLPVNTRVEVDVGQRVRAGAFVLAKLVHKQPNTAEPPRVKAAAGVA